MNARIRDTLLCILPPALISAKRRLFPVPSPRPAQPSAAELEHHRLNADVPKNEMLLRPGCRLTVHPESRAPFTAFCFYKPEMVSEMDGHIQD